MLKALSNHAESTKQGSIIFITVGFAMIVLILTFVLKRTLLLDISLFFLLISMFFYFEIYTYSTTVTRLIIKESERPNLLRKIEILVSMLYFGEGFFFIGLF